MILKYICKVAFAINPQSKEKTSISLNIYFYSMSMFFLSVLIMSIQFRFSQQLA